MVAGADRLDSPITQLDLLARSHFGLLARSFFISHSSFVIRHSSLSIGS
ncbi:MAG: hypothetical protein RM368_38830 [Nostoc sp. DedSLP03]|nr:hypothetical protein [Nostoc sp. DedSLP03]